MKREELVRYDGEWYDANIVDCLLDEKDAEIAALKAMAEEREKEIEFMHSNCKWYAGDGCARLHGELMAAVGDVGELKAEIESLKASHYADSVDAGMRERRLQRALWIARAELCRRLDIDRYLRNHRNSWYNENCLTWADACVAMDVKMCKAESKCQAKAEEYK